MTELARIVSIMAMVGIPSIFSLLVACVVFMSKFFKSHKILQQAVKSQMRSDLFKDWQKYHDQNGLTKVEQDEWLNRYKNYMLLVGDNEVLETKKDEIVHMQYLP